MTNATGSQVYIEVTAPNEAEIESELYAGGNVAAAIGHLTQVDFSIITASIASLVEKMASDLRPKPGGPSSCEVQFGVKVNAEGGIIVSKLGGEVSMTVKVVWDRT